MSPDKYNRVKEIFLAACDKPDAERTSYIQNAAKGDAEILREVESLLHEHHRDTQIMPNDPESPIGSMSAILSHAGIEVGQPIDDPDAQPDILGQNNTRYLDESSTSSLSSSHSGFVDAGRFMAGTMVAGRYRIIELLGRGGMGEVYRADDITLNQSIALKFLPALFGQDQTWLERFKNEVRLARQVTHPNVCRVFDIGEFQGEQFISMEYIDGENLGSLLRRIGRVPHDKALQIARQLCAGLAAAHDRGVLHRDLKPANVMIDGRGYVRITDFGLAAPAEQLRKDGAAALRAGTPAYMSPEQLSGRGVTVRSDIYSVGLVLYEMFTGRRAFRGETLRDYQKLHSSEEPTPPSEIIDDIDPIVERVILKCLEKDPKNRPASAMAVSAALPGGNPLREILAAGETPSPEVVAAAGEAHIGLRPHVATNFLIVGLVCMFFVIMLAPRAFVVQKSILEKPPAVLADKAREYLTDLGYAPKARDAASGFTVNARYYDHVDHLQTAQRGFKRWNLLVRPRPGLISFWYRQSPDLIVPWRPDSAVSPDDPPLVPGGILMKLDPWGYLSEFVALPADAPAPPAPSSTPSGGTQPATGSAIDVFTPTGVPTATEIAPPDWTPLLIASHMPDRGHFEAADPAGVPPVYVDYRAAWEGSFDDAPEEKLHVEAGAYHGKPVYFAITGGWKEESLPEDKATLLSLGNSSIVVQTFILILLLVAGGLMAMRSYRSGRGDRPGASRMGLAFFFFGFIAWLLRVHHVPDLIMEFRLFTHGMGPVVFTVVLVWIFYMALEPHVRRVWPETIISWSRMLAGRWIDPLVGRDVLIGTCAGTVVALLTILDQLIPAWMDLRAPMPRIFGTIQMLESATSFSTLFSGAIIALFYGLLMLLLLVVLRLLLRQKPLISVLFIAVFVAGTARFGSGEWLSWIVQIIIAILFLTLLIRHGLVAMIFCIYAYILLTYFPITYDFTAWYRSASIVAILATIALLSVGTYAALGGKSFITLRLPDA
ncbi:MAG TPA: serine/threonine-protein kinase [Phycisphaerae bacterium]|nr:serine/threonine-protein kinase [Phycisphaerae bacterium]